MKNAKIFLKPRVVRYTSTDRENTITSNERSMLILLGTVVLGVLVGTITFMTFDSPGIFTHTFLNHGFFKSPHQQDIWTVAVNSFFNTALPLIILFLCGFCAVAQPVEFFILFYRGITLGISMSLTYATYGYKGILIGLTMVVPGAVITTVILLFAAREALRSSNLYTKFALASEIKTAPTKLYAVKFTVLLGLSVFSAMTDSLLVFLFKGLTTGKF
ncbi:MAG: hypothetical protein LBR54_00270 [Oscillospiraceae bacterium]|jgi:hypothetical protein|nr:hypothetical protein [Oscillospiraceae bacterium]